jgi:hypothetical protein
MFHLHLHRNRDRLLSMPSASVGFAVIPRRSTRTRILVHGRPLPRSKLNPENNVKNFQNLSCINYPGIWLNLRSEKQPPGPTVRNRTQIMRTTSCNREVLLAFGFWLLAFGFWLLAFGFCQLIKRAVKRSLEFRCTAPYLAYCSSTAKLGAT